MYTETSSLRTLKIMPRTSMKLCVHEFGLVQQCCILFLKQCTVCTSYIFHSKSVRHLNKKCIPDPCLNILWSRTLAQLNRFFSLTPLYKAEYFLFIWSCFVKDEEEENVTWKLLIKTVVHTNITYFGLLNLRILGF